MPNNNDQDSGDGDSSDSLWIDKIGVEIEIGIHEDFKNRDITGFRKEGDGSLRVEEYVSYKREYVSHPVSYPDGVEDLMEGVNQIYGIVHEVNYSMGLHIHVSFNRDEDRERLASLQFQDFFLNRLKESELYNRNRSDSERLRKRVEDREPHPAYSDSTYGHYAQKIKDRQNIDKMLRHTGGRRERKYRLFRLHPSNTIEFRIFPAMEKAERVKEAIDIVTTSINAYLRQGRYKEKFGDKLKKGDIPEEVVEQIDGELGEDTSKEAVINV